MHLARPLEVPAPHTGRCKLCRPFVKKIARTRYPTGPVNNIVPLKNLSLFISPISVSQRKPKAARQVP